MRRYQRHSAGTGEEVARDRCGRQEWRAECANRTGGRKLTRIKLPVPGVTELIGACISSDEWRRQYLLKCVVECHPVTGYSATAYVRSVIHENRMGRLITILFLLFTIAACAPPGNVMIASPAGGGHAAMSVGGDAQGLDPPVDLIPEALGPYTWPISTTSREAPAY